VWRLVWQQQRAGQQLFAELLCIHLLLLLRLRLRLRLRLLPYTILLLLLLLRMVLLPCWRPLPCWLGAAAGLAGLSHKWRLPHCLLPILLLLLLLLWGQLFLD
jgi:hypothetical protein